MQFAVASATQKFSLNYCPISKVLIDDLISEIQNLYNSLVHAGKVNDNSEANSWGVRRMIVFESNKQQYQDLLNQNYAPIINLI